MQSLTLSLLCHLLLLLSPPPAHIVLVRGKKYFVPNEKTLIDTIANDFTGKRMVILQNPEMCRCVLSGSYLHGSMMYKARKYIE